MSLVATLDARRAASVGWDVIVAGAGPAGARLAGMLAGDGLRTLLVDRDDFPRDKVCGCCLSARTLGHLERAGIALRLWQRGGVPLRRLRIAAWRRQAELPLPEGMAISRRELDARLVERALENGADFLPRHRVRVGAPGREDRRVELRCGDGIGYARAAVVVDAAGLGGRLIGADEAADSPRSGNRAATASGRHRRIGCSAKLEAGTAYRPGTVYMAVAEDGYVGAVVLEDGALRLAAALDPRAVRTAGIAETTRRVLSSAGQEPPPGLSTARWSGTPALRQSPRRRAGTRLLAGGDAAGYVEPFTGEGIGWALRSAELLAPLVQRGAERWTPALEAQWDDLYARELRREQRGCRMVSWLLSHPPAARISLELLRWRPGLGARVVHRFQAPDLAPAGTRP